jgi:nucleotide-binding universal stress UspA family protein
MFKTIMIADDGSEGAGKGLRLAIDLAKQSGAALHIVCVEEIPDFPETIAEVKNEKRIADRHYRAILRRAQELAETQGVKPHGHLRTGHPVRDIVRLAAELRAGATGHSSFYEKVLGTRADRLVDLAPCPVLVAK